MLTVYPQSRLFSEMQAGRWTEAGEVEKLEELKTLVEHGAAPLFCGLGASNAVSVHGFLPEERDAVAAKLARACRPEPRGRPAPLPGRFAASVVEVILEKHIGIV